MPLITRPTQTIKIVLPEDVGKEPEPAFFYKPLTYRQATEILEYQNNIRQATDDKILSLVGDNHTKLFKMLTENLVGWENIPKDYNSENLIDIISLKEAFELLGLIAFSQEPTIEDKKKSE